MKNLEKEQPKPHFIVDLFTPKGDSFVKNGTIRELGSTTVNLGDYTIFSQRQHRLLVQFRKENPGGSWGIIRPKRSEDVFGISEFLAEAELLTFRPDFTPQSVFEDPVSTFFDMIGEEVKNNGESIVKKVYAEYLVTHLCRNHVDVVPQPLPEPFSDYVKISMSDCPVDHFLKKSPHPVKANISQLRSLMFWNILRCAKSSENGDPDHPSKMAKIMVEHYHSRLVERPSGFYMFQSPEHAENARQDPNSHDFAVYTSRAKKEPGDVVGQVDGEKIQFDVQFDVQFDSQS